MPDRRHNDTDELGNMVSAAQAGDERAFNNLYRALQPGLLRYLYALVRTDAEDVAAETWLQITRDLGRFRGSGPEFRAWTVTIARHRALDHLRHVSRQPSISAAEHDLTVLAGDDDTVGQALAGLSTRDAVALIASLPRDQAEAVLLRVVIGLDAKSVGQILGKRAGAVRMATFRGLRELARRLDPDTPVTHRGAPALKEAR